MEHFHRNFKSALYGSLQWTWTRCSSVGVYKVMECRKPFQAIFCPAGRKRRRCCNSSLDNSRASTETPLPVTNGTMFRWQRRRPVPATLPNRYYSFVRCNSPHPPVHSTTRDILQRFEARRKCTLARLRQLTGHHQHRSSETYII